MRTTKVAVFVAALWLCAPGRAAALEIPVFSKGGGIIAVEFGPGFWVMDRSYLSSQIAAGPDTQFRSVANEFANEWVSNLKTSYTLSARFGYNILGYASVEVGITATGWDALTTERGGAGFVAGLVRFHPLQVLFAILKKDPRPVALDLSTYFGWGYGIAGFGYNATTPLAPAGMGSDGFAWQWGFDVEYFLTRAIGFSLGVRGCFPGFDQIRIDFDAKVGPHLPNTIGGAFWTPTIGVVMRIGD